jgi:Acetyltransferase (GNAT) domain
MNNQVKIRIYQETDIDAVVDLLNLCFPIQNITRQTFLWKHFDPIFGNLSKAMVAIIDTQIVGFIAYTPTYIPDQDKSMTLFWNCGVVAVSPYQRRKGIATKLTLAVEQILDYNSNYLGFSNQSGVKIDQNSKSINYQILGQLSRHIILPVPLLFLYEVKIQLNLKAFLDSLKILNNYKRDFLEWRYVLNPKFAFQAVQVCQNNQILGTFIIYQSRLTVEILEIINCEDLIQVQRCIQVLANYFCCRKFKLLKIRCLYNDQLRLIIPFYNIRAKLPIYFTIKTRNKYFLSTQNHFILGGNIL